MQYVHIYYNKYASLVAQMVKRLPVMWETRVQALGWEDPLKKEIVISNAAMNTEVHKLSPISVFLFSLENYTELELLDHMVVQFLIFWGPSILFSIMAVPIYIPTNSVQESPFLHIFANTYCFCPF